MFIVRKSITRQLRKTYRFEPVLRSLHISLEIRQLNHQLNRGTLFFPNSCKKRTRLLYKSKIVINFYRIAIQNRTIGVDFSLHSKSLRKWNIKTNHGKNYPTRNKPS